MILLLKTLVILSAVAVQDTVYTQAVSETVQEVETSGTEVDFGTILSYLLGGGGILAVLIKGFLDNRKKRIEAENGLREKQAELEAKLAEQHSTANIEMDKDKLEFAQQEKMVKLQDDSDFKQKIIYDIYNKYVEQTEKMTAFYYDKIESLMQTIMEMNTQIQNNSAQNDKMTGRLDQFEKRYIKNSNYFTGRLDTVAEVLGKFSATQQRIIDEGLMKKEIESLIEGGMKAYFEKLQVEDSKLKIEESTQTKE
jgi:uncharacterized coiled-coil protein SlyX